MSIHDILTALAALAAVVIMILLARFGARLVGVAQSRGASNDALSLEASLSLDPKRRLCLIGCHGHHLLLLTGGPTDLLVGWLPTDAAVTEPKR